MAFDEKLGERIREVLSDRRGITEKRMFGGIAFLWRGHMVAGVVGSELMVRVGPDAYDQLVSRPHARPMDFTGRPMRGMVFVAPSGLKTRTALARWIDAATAFAESLPHEKRASPSRGTAVRTRS